MLLLTDRWMNMLKQVGVLQNLLLKHAYKDQIIYPIGINVSAFHQSCPPPPNITILNINSTQSGSCSVGLLTQHTLLVADQCFVIAIAPLKMGPTGCPVMSVNNYQYTSCLHNNPQGQGTHLQQSRTLNLIQNSASSYFWSNYLACQIYLRHKWPDVNIHVLLQVKCLLFLPHSKQTRIWSTNSS